MAEPQTLEKATSLLAYYGELLWTQWFPVLLVPILFGIVVLFKRSRALFYFFCVFLVATIFLTAIATNMDVSGKLHVVNEETKILVSVFFIPSYAGWALLGGVGLYSILSFRRFHKMSPFVKTGLAGIIIFSSAYVNFSKVDMSQNVAARSFTENLFKVVEKDALVLTNHDFFTFPIMYAQSIEKQRSDVIVWDTDLMKNSWYLECMRDQYPAITGRVSRAIDDHLFWLRRYEAGDRSVGEQSYRSFQRMLQYLIMSAEEEGRVLYATYDPGTEISGYYYEPVLVALKLNPRPQISKIPSPDSLDFRPFFNPNATDVRSRFFRGYHGELFFSRGRLLETSGQSQMAFALYHRSLPFLTEFPELSRQASLAMSHLSTVENP